MGDGCRGAGAGRGGRDDLGVGIMRWLDREVGTKIAGCKSASQVGLNRRPVFQRLPVQYSIQLLHCTLDQAIEIAISKVVKSKQIFHAHL